MPDNPATDITVQAFAEVRESGAVYTLLDVREADEIAICAFDDSLNIPMQQTPANLDKLPGAGTLVVVCHLGQRSAQVAAWLRQNGFPNAVNLAGGIDAWAREVDNDFPIY